MTEPGSGETPRGHVGNAGGTTAPAQGLAQGPSGPPPMERGDRWSRFRRTRLAGGRNGHSDGLGSSSLGPQALHPLERSTPGSRGPAPVGKVAGLCFSSCCAAIHLRVRKSCKGRLP